MYHPCRVARMGDGAEPVNVPEFARKKIVPSPIAPMGWVPFGIAAEDGLKGGPGHNTDIGVLLDDFQRRVAEPTSILSGENVLRLGGF